MMKRLALSAGFWLAVSLCHIPTVPVSCAQTVMQDHFVANALNWRITVPPQAPVSATLNGSLEDQAGDAVTVARVTLKNLQTGATHQTAVDLTGYFHFENLALGQYQLKAEAAGYQAIEQPVTLTAKQLKPLKLRLGINLEDEVTISATGNRLEQLIAAPRNADRMSMDDKLLRSLPAAGQDVLSVVSNFVSPAAQGGEGVSVIVDGVETGAAGLSASTIEQIRINRNPYAAQYRRPGKARLEITTEDGSYRRFHGGANFVARNSVFDARNAFALTIPELDRRLFEINLNGPLWRKRAAFFVSGERLLDNESAVINAQTLTGAVRANVPTPERRTRLFSRLDFKLNDRHRLALRYDLNAEAAQNRHLGGLRLLSQAYDSQQRRHTLQLTEHSILSATWLNDLRVVVARDDERAGVLSAQPEIAVAGAFIGGAPQTFSAQRERSFIVQDNAAYFQSKHEIRFGGELRAKTLRVTEADNFGGVFRFASLAQYAAGQPYQFRLRRGDPRVALAQREAAGFFQDEWKPRAGLSLTLGGRYQWQTNLRDWNNFAPRFGFASALFGPKTVLRGGVGLFHERVPEIVWQRALLNDGVRLQELVLSNPSYPDPGMFVAGQASQTLPSITRVAADLVAPYQWQASLGVERELWGRNTVTVEYQTLRGNRLLRSRNVNAPLPGTKQRLDGRYLNINQVESSARSCANALTVSWRGRFTKRLHLLAQYTLAKAQNDTGGRFDLPADNYNLRPEWGRADFDQRHRLNWVAMLELPRGFRFGTVWLVATGRPFEITTGRDDNGDTVANDRPAGLRRNAGQSTGYARADLRAAKSFNAPHLFGGASNRDNATLEIGVDVFNLFNHTNFTNYIGVQSSPFFGQPNAALQARALQFSLRYRF